MRSVGEHFYRNDRRSLPSVPKTASMLVRARFGDAFDDTVYLVRSSPGIIWISCLRSIFPYSLQAEACPRSFFLLFAECEALVRFFFFLSRKKEEKCWKKNSLKFNQNILLTQTKNKNHLPYKSKFEKNPKSTIKSDIALFFYIKTYFSKKQKHGM